MSDETNVIAQVDTPLGRAQLHLPIHAQVSASATVSEAHPELPAGMRVDRTVRIDVQIKALADIAPMMFAFLLDCPQDQGSPESSEGLESVRFNALGTQVSLAARDAHWMLDHGIERKLVPAHLRADPFAADFASWLMHYRPQGFLVEIEKLYRGDTVICPLAISYASAQPDSHNDESTWYAVEYALP
ncbi:MAG: hypothetical protein AB7V13_18825 [Pseudorhodoplanes sp.]